MKDIFDFVNNNAIVASTIAIIICAIIDTIIQIAFKKSDNYNDPLYNEIVEFAVYTGKVSAALIQRKFNLGYNRAARLIDILEERGIIGPQRGSKPREVLIKIEND